MRALSIDRGFPASGAGRDKKESLGGLVGNPHANLCVLVTVAFNVLLLLYSHLGTSGIVDSNLGVFGEQTGSPDGRRAMDAQPVADLAAVEGTEFPSSSSSSSSSSENWFSSKQNGVRSTAASLNLCHNSALDESKWKMLSMTNIVDLLLDCNLKGEKPCFGKSGCVSACVESAKGFSTPCASCFGQVSSCAVNKCILKQGAKCTKSSDPGCHQCLKEKCALSFMSCAGLELPIDELGHSDSGSKGAADDGIEIPSHLSEGSCAQLHTLYEIQFVDAVRKAWNGGAAWLAFVLAVASGLWPYVKNALILLVWFRPLPVRTRGRVLWLMGKLGKWSYVDVFVMILLNATLRIEKNLSSQLQFMIVSYPRGGVFCFAIAATASLLQSEWLRIQHEEYLAVDDQVRGRLASSNGRLRSHWRQTAARNLTESKALNRRASLTMRLLVPVFCVVAIVIACYALVAIEFELKGTIALLPGENHYSYSIDEILRSIITQGRCIDAASSETGRVFLFAIFFLTVLVMPTVVCVAAALLWIVRSRASALESWIVAQPICVGGSRMANSTRRQSVGGGERLEVTIDLCSAFACLDVFGVSLLLVTIEIDKVVRAVGQAANVNGVDVDMLATLKSGGYMLVVAIMLFWLTLVLNKFDDRAFASLSVGSGYNFVRTYSQDYPNTITTITEEDGDDEDMYEDVEIDDPSAEHLPLAY